MVMDGGNCGEKRRIFHPGDEGKSTQRLRRENSNDPILRGMEANQGA